jgi:iron-sulfur cluster repair protein YtfE (RIC family)
LDFRIPGPLKVEHEDLYEDLNRAARTGGKVGDAAMLAFKTFQNHRRREEEFAFPLLGLLGPLANKGVSSELSRVVSLCDRFREQMPDLIHEHDEMRKALQVMNDAALREEKPEDATLAKRLLQHMSMEEQIFYPAALVAGEYVKSRLYGAPSLPLPK